MHRRLLPANYKWIALSITTIGAFMVSIDATVVILAIPDMLIELRSNLVILIWVVMAYIFASTVLLLSLGRVADIYGRVRLYNIGFTVFTVGSLLCGLSQTDFQLISSRVFQGVGGALMLVNAWAIVTESFPANERGTAMGINSLTFALGSIAGPLLGGFILSVASWRWIFLINLPIGIAGTYFSYRYLQEMSEAQPGERLDPVGILAFSACLFALLFALTQGATMGFTSPLILASLAVFVAALGFFIIWEEEYCCPALDLRLFKSREFNFAIVSATLQSLAVFAVQFLVVFYLQAVRGYSPLTAAFLLLPMPLGLAIAGPLSGRLADRIGARIPASLGLCIQAAGVFWLSTITPFTPYSFIVVGLALTGIGGGMFYSPNTSAAMSASPRGRLGVAAATLATLRNTGMVTSFALALAISAGTLPSAVVEQLFLGTATYLGTATMYAFVAGMETALHVSAFICLLAAGFSFVRGPRPASTAI